MSVHLSARTISVLVVDDHPVVLNGIAQILRSSPGFEVVATAGSGRKAIQLAERYQPEIVLLDLRLPDLPAPNICQQLRLRVPKAKIVILTAYDDRPVLLACQAAGATGIVLKDAREMDLLQVLRDVYSGKTVLDRRIMPGKRGSEVIWDEEQGVYSALTPREYDVLCLLAEGKTTDDISRELQLTRNTVRSYTQAVLGKLQARSRVEALAVARRLKLI